MVKREIRFYKSHFNEFYARQNEKVKRKIAQTLVWLQTVERLPNSILKHIEGSRGLYEIKIEFGSETFRIFCCFDKGAIIVLFNGFQKKTTKTPKQEIEKAEKLMNEYFKVKSHENR